MELNVKIDGSQAFYQLRKHKFRHSYGNKVNPLCCCSL